MPVQPLRVNLPAWFLPTWFPFSRIQGGHFLSAAWHQIGTPSLQGARVLSAACATAHLHTKILDLRGFDSSGILILRVGILMSMENFPKSLSQRILVGIVLVGRLGVLWHPRGRATLVLKGAVRRLWGL